MFGARLKHLRESRNLKQHEIAKLLDVNREAYSHYETERRKVSPNVIVTLAKYYNVTTDYMFGLTDSEKSPEQELLEKNRDTLLRLQELLGSGQPAPLALTDEERNCLLKLVANTLSHDVRQDS
ncbi:helix-turn-helix transcriptional regulator [Tumebacillus sp. ITR2]|uniref:Helix-turn-helix transcriptional regulator n=1 Tax=Tumebacillus amylolyticus TaxID=2801339 RepID=A0ABS1J9B4_9BACL|nr:helix-turn-helix transcriptional regulator [Tumebacillus amylolyticus]MBL0386805.1 helix-turn-helix transcriptional regulator [Tumebacillus amylolyticus]